VSKPKICATKNVLQKGLETKKKNLRWGLNPQLSWLTTVCLRGFDRNGPQKMTGVPCLPFTPVPSMHCNERTKAVSNQHIRVPRLRAFNFAQFLLRCVLGMRSNSVVKTEF